MAEVVVNGLILRFLLTQVLKNLYREKPRCRTISASSTIDLLIGHFGVRVSTVNQESDTLELRVR